MKYFEFVIFGFAVIACSNADRVVDVWPSIAPISNNSQIIIPDVSQIFGITIKPFDWMNGTRELIRKASGRFNDVIGNFSNVIESEVNRFGGEYTDYIGNLTQFIQEAVLSVNGSSYDVTGNITSIIAQQIQNSNSSDVAQMFYDIAQGFQKAVDILEGPVQQFYGAFINLLKEFIPDAQDITDYFKRSFDPINATFVTDFESYLRNTKFPEYEKLFDSIKNSSNGLDYVASQYGNLSTAFLNLRNYSEVTRKDYLMGLNKSIDLNKLASIIANNLSVSVNESSQLFLSELYTICNGLKRNIILGRRVNESVASLLSCVKNEITRLNNSLINLQNEYQALENNAFNAERGISAIETATGIAINSAGIKERIFSCEADQSRKILQGLIPIYRNWFLCNRF